MKRDNSYIFGLANESDIGQIAKMEEKYFKGYERLFTYDFLKKWYVHNKNMYYTVKKNDKVLAFAIFVPITLELHNRLLEGEVSDLFDFEKSEVCCTNHSDYYYLADICVDDVSAGAKAVGILIKELFRAMQDKVKYVTTSPITKLGLKMTEHIGFKKVAQESYNGKNYDIYLLEVGKETMTK